MQISENQQKGVTIMSRIEPINYEQSTGKAKELLDAVKSKLGMTPNLMTTMAHSPAVLEAYLNFNATLGTTLNAKLREQISVLTAEENGCGYCAAAHTALGKMAGLDENAILAAREGNSSDAKTDAALKFARQLILQRGKVSDDDLQTVKTAGFSDGEIGEIVANVALNIFTNYFNETAKTVVDFPAIEFPLKLAAKA
jgi:uncharacterized peroxidase-related enzyme